MIQDEKKICAYHAGGGEGEHGYGEHGYGEHGYGEHGKLE